MEDKQNLVIFLILYFKFKNYNKKGKKNILKTNFFLIIIK